MSSPLILSLSTVFALIGIVLVAIAFGTNNWQEYRVDRAALKLQLSRSDRPQSGPRQDVVNRSDLFYSRVYGLFRECFPNEVPTVARRLLLFDLVFDRTARGQVLIERDTCDVFDVQRSDHKKQFFVPSRDSGIVLSNNRVDGMSSERSW
ncbi:unnamed protein product [Soboliphyme baturini]|uniref:DUF3301 domain-containing protein n=1 Tax=Soboliphyme baturini TaxID=241478 RepID=A0A183IEF4_9BILA|nr:unnamed protein product [Soboliphyme baturini]